MLEPLLLPNLVARRHYVASGIFLVAFGWLGLDLDRLKNDMNLPEITKLGVDARTLNVTKTPEFFINGTSMPSFGYEELKTLVEEAFGQLKRKGAIDTEYPSGPLAYDPAYFIRWFSKNQRTGKTAC